MKSYINVGCVAVIFNIMNILIIMKVCTGVLPLKNKWGNADGPFYSQHVVSNFTAQHEED